MRSSLCLDQSNHEGLICFLLRTAHHHAHHYIQPMQSMNCLPGLLAPCYRFPVMTPNKHLLSGRMNHNILNGSLCVVEVPGACLSLCIMFIKHFELDNRGSVHTGYSYLLLKDVGMINQLIPQMLQGERSLYKN